MVKFSAVPCDCGMMLLTTAVAVAKSMRLDIGPVVDCLIKYLTTDPAANGWFARRRLALPVKGGAVAKQVDANESNWGRDDKLLQIGSKAVPFNLPKADGEKLALETYLGKKNIVVLTYRAFW